MIKSWILAAAVAVVAAPIAPAPSEAMRTEFSDRRFRVADIQARLLYEETGSLSEDISDNPRFGGFNVIIGEGSAKENANDLLITAVIYGPGQHNLNSALMLTARNARGKVIGSRTIGGVLAGRKTYRSMLLHDVGCAGIIRLTARLGQSVRTEKVQLDCGE